MSITLRYSKFSPFVRKVLVFAHETGLASKIECVKTDVWAEGSDIVEDNPLGKVPALITPDGTFIGSALCNGHHIFVSRAGRSCGNWWYTYNLIRL